MFYEYDETRRAMCSQYNKEKHFVHEIHEKNPKLYGGVNISFNAYKKSTVCMNWIALRTETSYQQSKRNKFLYYTFSGLFSWNGF